MSFLRLDSVMMAYGPHRLFAKITTEVGPGEALVVTGANGAGKSTLLRLVSGLARPAAGVIRYDGTIGFAAPDINVYNELTARENLAFFAGLRGLPTDPDRLLARVGLPRGRGADLVGAYSSGMRQRLKLAVSLLGDPRLLVWDEPTLALDAGGAVCVEQILQQHRQSGGIAVLATNDPAEAARWSVAGLGLHLGRG